MTFASPLFLLGFLPLVVLGFHLLHGAWCGRLRAIWLLSASIIFYSFAGVADAALLALSLACNATIAGQLIRRRAIELPAKWLLVLGVVGNILVLLNYKFLASAGGAASYLSAAGILIPLGLSFITFQQIAFLVDCHRGRIRQFALFDYVLFITFFPQLVMGPIVHYREIAPQLSVAQLSQRSSENLAVGFAIFCFGLFKKLVVADAIAPSVDVIYQSAADGEAVTLIDAWGAAVGFQLQLFMDFSAYADMAIGLARMFNINLPINYDNPYHARSRFDLWRRWHITFVEFMRTHVFLPLARISWMPTWAALAITCMASGLWHGFGWTFVLWGAVQTALLLVSHAWSRWRRGPVGQMLPHLALVQIVVTFAVSVVVGVLFRAPTTAGAMEIYRGMLSIDRPWLPRSLAVRLEDHGWMFGAPEPAELLLTYWDLLPFTMAAALIWWVPQTSALFIRYWSAVDPRPAVHRPSPASYPWLTFRLSWRWGLAVGLFLLSALLCLERSRRFVYFQF